MKTMGMDLFGDDDDQGVGLALSMDLDDADSSLDFSGDFHGGVDLHRLADTDFFNSFQDDFNDEDIN